MSEHSARPGFEIAGQKGSHIILAKDERIVPVPTHAEIKRGLDGDHLEAGLTKEEFLRLL